MSATKLVTLAKSWVGKSFHPGVTAQCAAFVSAMLDEAGFAWPHAVNKSWAPDLSGADNAKPIGKRVAFNALVAGDLVFFGNTYTPGTSTHVGIYIGAGAMVHRPTSDRMVEAARIDAGYWREKFEVGVRPFPFVKPSDMPMSQWSKLYLNENKVRAFEHGEEVQSLDLRAWRDASGELHVYKNGKEIKAKSVTVEIEEA